MSRDGDGLGAGRIWRVGVAILLTAAGVTGAAQEPAASATSSAAQDTERVVLDETVISGNQELPKVLYILPWQQPAGLPEIELRAHFAEEALFRRLYPPAYRREMSYFENLQEDHPED